MTISEIRPHLLVSDRQTVNTRSLNEFNVDMVVNLCTKSTQANVSCEYNQYEIRDSTHPYSVFSDAVETILEARKNNKTVLVHCQAGQSRSVSAVAAALAVEDNIELNNAYGEIQQNRKIHPSPELINSAIRFVDNHTSGRTTFIKDIINTNQWALCD